MRVLVLDNYDSFTYNLVQYFGDLGAEPIVVRNDELTPAEGAELKPDRLVISPGPGTPDDTGYCMDYIRTMGGEVPILGVCLGHQTIVAAFGGEVGRAPEPRHGKVSIIDHDGRGVFAGLPDPFEATRYHSLTATSVPNILEVTARSEDGVVQAVRHRHFPIEGVQFHPESIMTEVGRDLLRELPEAPGSGPLISLDPIFAILSPRPPPPSSLQDGPSVADDSLMVGRVLSRPAGFAAAVTFVAVWIVLSSPALAAPPAGNPDGTAPVPIEAQAVDTSHPNHVIGNGTPQSCTSAAVVAAVAQGGIITFDCGPSPVTIEMTSTAKVVNNTGPEIVIDGGGLVTLSGMGQRRILYMNTCDRTQVWTTSHCQNQDHPRLTVQNLTFVDGNAKGEDPDGGGAIFVRGGRFRVVNSRFFRNVCDDVGPDVGGAGIRVLSQYNGLPVYVVNSTFGGAPGYGNVCSNGGGISSIGVSWTLINSLFSYNDAIGNGANPAQGDAPGGGSGGAIYNDGNTFTLTLLDTRVEYNHANEGGGAIFFVSNDRSGSLIIRDSVLVSNPSDGFETRGYPGIFVLANGPPQVENSIIGDYPDVPDVCPDGADCDSVIFHDAGGRWHAWSAVASKRFEDVFYFGDPGDVAFAGDWDCDGIDTPGLYRRSDGAVYLRNSNTQGVADIRFFFGNPGDLPLPGDFDGDGCDSLSIYRPSESRIFVINELGSNNAGLGAADFDFVFGNPGDKPFVGDFNGNRIDTVGLHRESTGLVYFRNTLTTGIAHSQFIYGDPGDVLVAGDWDGDGDDTVAVYRPSNGLLYVKLNNTQGNADAAIPAGNGYQGLAPHRD